MRPRYSITPCNPRVWSAPELGDKIHIRRGWPPELDDALAKSGICRFELTDCDSDVLERLSVYPVRDLSVDGTLNRIDYSALMDMPELERLHLGKVRSLDMLDLSRLPKLTYLECRVTRLDGLAAAQSLLALSICCRIKSFEAMPSLPSLRTLSMDSPGLSSLSGIQKFDGLTALHLVVGGYTDLLGLDEVPRLERLSLCRMKHLATLEGIGGAPALRGLWIEDCRKLDDLFPIADLPQLEDLRLEELGRVKSASFLLPLKKLRYFSMDGIHVGTVAEDATGLEALTRLENLVFADLTHADHYPIEKLQPLIGLRQWPPVWKF